MDDEIISRVKNVLPDGSKLNWIGFLTNGDYEVEFVNRDGDVKYLRIRFDDDGSISKLIYDVEKYDWNICVFPIAIKCINGLPDNWEEIAIKVYEKTKEGVSDV